jgi:hypothetical protein
MALISECELLVRHTSNIPTKMHLVGLEHSRDVRLTTQIPAKGDLSASLDIILILRTIRKIFHGFICQDC